jgi:hypothetical protein
VFRDAKLIASHRPIQFPLTVVSLILLTYSIWGVAVFSSIMFRYPILFCCRIEVRSNLLTMFSYSGRKLAQIDNVVAEVRRESAPTAVWFRAAPGSRDNFDVPLWLVEEPMRTALLRSVGWKPLEDGK